MLLTMVVKKSKRGRVAFVDSWQLSPFAQNALANLYNTTIPEGSSETTHYEPLSSIAIRICSAIMLF